MTARAAVLLARNVVFTVRMVWRARREARRQATAALDAVLEHAASMPAPEPRREFVDTLGDRFNRERDVVYLGVCGEDRGHGDVPAGCGRPFTLTPVSVQVNRLLGACAGWEWQVQGFCPACGYLCVSHFCADPAAAQELVGDGAAEVFVSRPGEVDEIAYRAKARKLTEDDLKKAWGLLDDDARLAESVALLARRFGS